MLRLPRELHGRVTSETKPSIILDYNKYMGGIDTFDMMLYSYLDEHRTVKYWKKVVFNLFARMVINAYIIYKENCQQNNVKPLSRYNFTVQIIESITEEWVSYRDGVQRAGGDNRKMGIEKLPGKKKKHALFALKKDPTSKLGGKGLGQFALIVGKDATGLASRNINVRRSKKCYSKNFVNSVNTVFLTLLNMKTSFSAKYNTW